MVTMIKAFLRHVWESLKSLKRNGWMSLASTSAVTITLILAGVFLTVIMNITKIASDIENDVNVTAFIDIGTNKKEMDALKKDIQKVSHVKKIKFSGKDDQLKNIQSALGDAWELFQGDSNPLYDIFIVSTDSPSSTKEVAKKIGDIKHIYKADYGGASSDRLIAFTKNIQTWGLGAAGLLLFVAIFLISNTIRITIISRQTEIQIMRLVGAQNGFIRWPFFLEGAWIGLIGAIVPVVLIWVSYKTIYGVLNPELMRSHYSMYNPGNFLPQITGLVTLIGIFIGSFGSVIAMRRFLKL
ncbi:MAG: permease-like cell division protein FtsX [Lactobacillales bacterium]|jgi:cell division transport system permease protein|nr:permease-like cell division protein FtsX [Lactobacillales bacterium]